MKNNIYVRPYESGCSDEVKSKRTPYTKREPKPKRFVVYKRDEGKTWGAAK